MSRRFENVSRSEFVNIINVFPFKRRINEVHLHHTWRPRQRDYKGESTIAGMWRYHTQTNGWSDIAQHVTVAPDGAIWLGRNFNWAPASASGFNGNSSAGPFMIEMIGDFDVGKEEITKAQKAATLTVIRAVQEKFSLSPDALRFHNEMSSKSCPGTQNDKEEWIKDVSQVSLPGARKGARAAPFEETSSRAWQLISSMSPEGVQPDGELLASADHPVGYDALEARNGGAASSRGKSLTEAMLAELADHIINLEMGQFSDDGEVTTDTGDVDRLFDELLPAEIESKTHGEKAKLVFYAHGGLVPETDALVAAFKQLKFWRANGVYPVFFIWETGLFETIGQMTNNARKHVAEPHGGRAFVTDGVVEEIVRFLGGVKIWSGMKRSAELASGDGGGAAYVSKRAAEFLNANSDKVEIHTIGHSAGSIFHAHFMPRLIGDGAKIKSAHFMAPAIRNDLFHAKIAPSLGNGIGSLSIFTMRKRLERRDTVTFAYRKSLLYLIHEALEAKRREPILGLEVSLRGDKAARKIFGLGRKNSKRADVVWSKSDGTDTGNGSQSTTHGGFDDDPATMESIARRILKLKNGENLSPFPASRAGALEAGSWDERIDWPEHLRA